MTVLPVIVRELRAEARHSFTYWLRVLGAMALLLVSVWFGLDRGFSIDQGGRLFQRLNLTLFCSIWILVPLVSADCISREKREGTLGLLFLTPLKATDIVVAKVMAHGLRALTMCLAVLPVLAMPFLMGGVGWRETVMACLFDFSAFCWALGAGLLASSRSKVWLRSIVGAGIWAVLFLLLFGALTAYGISLLLSSSGGAYGWWEMGLSRRIFEGLSFATNSSDAWKYFLSGRFPGALGGSIWVSVAIAVAVSSLLGLFLIINLAARNAKRGWQEHPPSALQLWWEEKFCTPVVWVSFFRGWMRRKLERNPIGWLEQRTWSGRLVMWGWLAVMISLDSVALGGSTGLREIGVLQKLLAWLLVGSMAMSAAGSFRRERETRVLELLLVSPLNEKQIIGGRLRGLWGQFLPAIVLLIGLWLYCMTSVDGERDTGSVWFFGITFLTLPVVGLFYSLRWENFISAFLWTLLVGVLLPMMLPALMGWVLGLLTRVNFYFLWQTRLMAASALQLLFAAILLHRLHANLAHRKFALGKP